MLGIKITDKRKFKKVSEVEFSSKSIYKDTFDGDVFIQLKNGCELTSTGEHWVKDFEEAYGFIVVEQ